jgi:hypothetical protein
MDLTPAFEGLNDRDRIYVQSRLSGLSQVASAGAAGLAVNHANEFEKQPRIANALALGRKIGAQETGYTREKISEMLVDAYRCATTAAEMIMAARELGRLHGVYAPQKVDVDHVHRLKNIKNEQDVRRLTTADLVRLVDARGTDVIDADFVDVVTPGTAQHGNSG